MSPPNLGHRLIYFIGAPGSGKSTLMAALTSHLEREPITDASGVAHDRLRFARLDYEFPEKGEASVESTTAEIAGAEIGRRRDKFGGTDALPASIIEKAIPWVQSKPYELILGEGARLANKRFLTAAAEAGYRVHLVWLNHEEIADWRAAREEALGHAQNPSWVKGRETATINLATHFATKPELGVKVYSGHPDKLIEDLEHLLG